MTDNPFKAPESDIEVEIIHSEMTLASRWSRLWASLLDSIIMMTIVMPLLYFLGWFDYFSNGEQPPLLFTLSAGIIGFCVFFLINFNYLKQNGQTIGKKIVGIKIVDMEGNQAQIKQHILKRYIAYFLPNQVPVAGSLFQFINVLFVFRKDKRCIHDLIGGTQVVCS